MKRALALITLLGLSFAAPMAVASDPCDYNGDTVVDSADTDAIMAASAAGVAEGDADWNPAMDHDGDGAISLVDVSSHLEQSK